MCKWLNEGKATEDLSKPTNPDVKGVGEVPPNFWTWYKIHYKNR